ncbi:hypothetical protein BDM02DRAFT_3168441 [Thelephora ganbajun]|uniref:Uncharacterized protein n=1 Tax=Thelephora ganbajun TaxID=370292 RepID=A0ACB6ZFM8_THEGA|nr:hypothetical protein BDM02DRAFT_3168441 [Thelephora ganbajun]
MTDPSDMACSSAFPLTSFELRTLVFAGTGAGFTDFCSAGAPGSGGGGILVTRAGCKRISVASPIREGVLPVSSVNTSWDTTARGRFEETVKVGTGNKRNGSTRRRTTVGFLASLRMFVLVFGATVTSVSVASRRGLPVLDPFRET